MGVTTSAHREEIAKLPVAQFCVEMLKGGVKEIVDVGCGDGVIAHKLIEEMKCDPNVFVGVDIDPKRKTKFSNYQAYLQQSKQPHGLLIHWPLPNHSIYDIEALQELKAHFAVLLIDTTGGAGGSQLLQFLRELGLPHVERAFARFEYINLLGKWQIKASQETTKEYEIGLIRYTVLLIENQTLSRKSAKHKTSLPPVTTPK